MREDDLKALETRWHELYDQYDAVKALIPEPVRWEWTNRARYDPRPFYFHRGAPRGIPLRQSPSDKHQRVYKHQYCFDEQGRVVIEHYHTYYDRWETFYIYTPDTVEILDFAKFDNRMLLSEIAKGVFESGRMQTYTSLKVNYGYIDPSLPFPVPGQVELYRGESLQQASSEAIWQRLLTKQYAIEWRHENYVYEGKKLDVIQVYHQLLLFSEPFNDEYRLEYNTANQLDKITWVRGTGYQRVVYRRRKPGETWASLTEIAQQKLIAEIPKMIAAANFKEPLYCLNLYYNSEQPEGDYFPPQFKPGFELDREYKLRTFSPEQVDGYIWWFLLSVDNEDLEEPIYDPDENPLLITELETLEACERLQVEVIMHQRFDIAVKTLYEISRELNTLDWTQYAPVTPDFIVYACDQTEHVDIPDSLHRSGATKAQIADWRKRGMLC